MKIIKPIVIIVLVMASSFLVMGIFGPSNYKVMRAIKISAPIETVFNQTSVFANWGAWSHWSQMDTNAVYKIENDNQEPGAIMTWEGDITGKGIMTSTEVIENKKFWYTIEFIEPWYMAGTSTGGFSYKNVGDSVLLTWTDEAPIGFLSRPMMLIMSVEDQIGPMFEQGLLSIKEICENMEVESAIEITEEIVESKSILFISASSSLMPNEIGAKMGAAYGELMALMGIAKLEMPSAPIAITKKYSLTEMTCEFDAAVTVVNLPDELDLDGRIEKGETYGGKALKIIHIGSYVTLKTTYDTMLAYIEKNGYEKNGFSWEEYIDDPTEVVEEERRTNIYFPIK